MICKKCGSSIEEKSKFCIYCGNKVEVIENTINTTSAGVKNNENIVREQRVDTTINQVHLNTSDNLLDKTVIVPVQQVNEQMPVESTTKKENKTLIFIILGVVLAIIAGVLLFISFNKSSNNSIKVLEKAINNFSDKGENSGTINLDFMLGSNESDSINLSATMKYAKVDYNYNVALTLNKSLLFDEINLYSTITDKDITLYTKSSLVDMIGMTSSPTDMWVHYILNLDEVIDTNKDVIKEESDVELSNIFDDKHYKYVGKKDGLRQYQLIIDNELISKIKKMAESSESLKESLSEIPEEQMKLEQPVYLDFYINESNELTKISMDVSKFLEEESVSKAIFEISFLNFGNTMVEIPVEAKNSKMDIMTYMSTYMQKQEVGNNITFN